MLGALLGGLLLNLMPCVLPVLAIKLLSLSQPSVTANMRRGIGLSYTLGVLLSMLGLALLVMAVRASGEQLGWGFQLQSPWVVVVTPSVPANTLREFIAHAKANPGKLRFGSYEPSSRLAGEQFKQQAGVDLTHVPYKGGSMIMTDMLGGHIEAGFTSTLTVLQHYKSGKLRVLAVAGKARHPSMPDVPTAIEAGLPQYETYAWYGMYTARNVPVEITSRIQKEIARIVQLPEMREKLNQFGAEPVANTPEQFAAFTRAEFEKYAKLIKQAGIQAE
jgi:tripartite-type tricarboxylate transporter receptor subunit TctC